MDITWQHTVEIAAPVEKVYAYLADFPRHAEWGQSIVELEQVRAGDSAGVGARYRTRERQSWQANRPPRAPLRAGTPGTTMCEVRELVPNRRIAWHSWVAMPPVGHWGNWAFELAPGASGTCLTQTVRLHDSPVSAVISRMVFGQTATKAYAQWEASLRNIKTILEEA
jgi:uncharacterized membrane protein